MNTVYIYDGETGKFKRAQEPMLDPLETKIQGENVYFTFPNSTELVPPETGNHEAAFFIDGTWIIKGQYKNVEVYNTDTKDFEYCSTDELAENQIFINDERGIKNYKADKERWIVDEETATIIENPDWERIVTIRELKAQVAELNKDCSEDNPRYYVDEDALEIKEYPEYSLKEQLKALYAQLEQTDVVYNTTLETPVVFPVTGKQYKAMWVDDGTYEKLITGTLAGLITFPIQIWDATKLQENMVEMDQTTFMQLVGFLAQIQATAFNTRKLAQAQLIPQIDAIERQLHPESEEESEEE